MSVGRIATLLLVTLVAPGVGAEETEKRRIEVDGRIFVRETYAEEGDADWGAQSSISSARLGLSYHRKQLRARLSVELRSSARLRSAYLDIAPIDDLDVRAGLFKIPLSPFELASSWTIPVADRGLTSTILRDRLQVAGRRVGAEVAWTPGVSVSVSVRAGYHQGLDDLGEVLDGAAADAFGKVATARVEVGPFGAVGQVRQGRPDVLADTRTAWAASGDATFEVAGLRLWVEAMLGSSWLVAKASRDDARFVEARGVAAWRLGGAKGGAPYVEPYALLGLVDPDASLADDVVLETTTGVNLGVWKRWRFQLELELWRFGANVPMGFVAPAVIPAARTAIVGQLGASF